MLEFESRRGVLVVGQDGGRGVVSVGAEGGLTRSGRVLGPVALKDMFAGDLGVGAVDE